MGNRVIKEMVVPKKVHGGVYNDGWFGSGAAWSSDESRIAYVAQVTLCALVSMAFVLALHLMCITESSAEIYLCIMTNARLGHLVRPTALRS